jgi:hypothetical protein
LAHAAIAMHDFTILTNARRALIALIHSVVFLGIALRSLIGAAMAGPIWREASIASLAVLTVYCLVTAVLVYLARISRCAREKFYFLFCSTSAGTGLLRALFGDPAPHLAPAIRVLMLGCAVATGIHILRGHSTLPVTMENQA